MNEGLIQRNKLLLLLGMTVLVAFIPIFLGRITFEEDMIHYYLPPAKFFSDAIKNQESFYIAPQVLSGFPAALSQYGGFWEPVNYMLFKWLPFPFVYFLRIFLNILFAAVFLFLFMREMGFGKGASFITATSFLIAQDKLRLVNIPETTSLVFLTGLFYILIKLFRQETFKNKTLLWLLPLGGLFIGTGMLGGYAQRNLYVLVGALLFVLFLVCIDAKEKKWRHLAAFIIFVCFIFALGGSMFYPHYTHVSEYLPYTHRGDGLSWEDAGGQSLSSFFSWNTPRGVFYFIIESLFPRTFRQYSSDGIYLGMIGLFFFIVSWSVSKSKYWYFFIFFLTFSYLNTFSYPLYWVFYKLPIFKMFRDPGQWMFMVSFAASFLAGYAYDVSARLSSPGLFKKCEFF